jgi:hypothetical protein
MTGAPNDPIDLDDVLYRLRPHAGDEYLAPGSDPHAEALLERISSRIEGSRPRRHARRVGVLVTGLAVVGASATAALIVSRSAGNPTELSCYSSPDVDAAVQVAVLPDAQRTPVEQCAELWSDGRISSDGAPHLVACVTGADVVAVIPGDESSCAAAGWTLAAVPSSQPDGDRTSELVQVLSDRFVDQCLHPESAAQAVEDVLIELGLSQWTIDDTTTDSDSCSAPVVDVATRSVRLISLPR